MPAMPLFFLPLLNAHINAENFTDLAYNIALFRINMLSAIAIAG
jgi:hypothetical protein